MRKVVSFLLAALVLVGAAAFGSQSGSANAGERQRRELWYRTGEHHHRHYGHRRHGSHMKRVPNANSLRKQSW